MKREYWDNGMLYGADSTLICTHLMRTLSDSKYITVISRLATERLQRKSNGVWRIFDRYLGD